MPAKHDHGRMLLVFVMPIGLNNIGWKMYMVNGSWDIITFFLIVRPLYRAFITAAAAFY
jgi:hypothetical protein